MQQTSEKKLTRTQTNVLYLLFILALSIGDIYSFFWIRTYTRMPLWGAILVTLPSIFVYCLVWAGWRFSLKNEQVVHRSFALPLFIVALFLGLYTSQRVSKLLVLICLYGLSTVQTEHLHFVSTEKAQPWIVSNGDHLPEAHNLWGLIDGNVIATIFFGIFIPVYHLLPKPNADGSTSISFIIHKRKTFSIYRRKK